jgi:hypothetical protein
MEQGMSPIWPLAITDVRWEDTCYHSGIVEEETQGRGLKSFRLCRLRLQGDVPAIIQLQRLWDAQKKVPNHFESGTQSRIASQGFTVAAGVPGCRPETSFSSNPA